MKKTAILLLAFGFSKMLVAQDAAPKWAVNFRAGLSDFRTPFLKSQSQIRDMNALGEISLSRRLLKGVSAVLPIRIGTVALPIETATDKAFHSNAMLYGADVMVQAMPIKPRWAILPYISTGLGGAVLGNETNFSMPFTAGLNFPLGKSLYLNFETQFRKSFNLNRDHWMHKVGLTWFIDEAWENRKEPIKIAEISPDSLLKAAAEVKALADAAEAEKKQQEELAAALKAKEEAEAREAIAKAEAEAAKKAEAEALALLAKDTDGDGIADIKDHCPATAGLPTNNGCPPTPIVTAEAQKVLTEALQGVQFETGKETLIESSYPILDKVVGVLLKNTNYHLLISGHTDSTGDELTNQTLSEARAKTCRDYLEKKGIEATRFRSAGYGSTQPRGDNKTVEGRTQNRRVEFSVY